MWTPLKRREGWYVDRFTKDVKFIRGYKELIKNPSIVFTDNTVTQPINAVYITPPNIIEKL